VARTKTVNGHDTGVGCDTNAVVFVLSTMSPLIRLFGATSAVMILAFPASAHGQMSRVAARTSASPSSLIAVRGTVSGDDLIRTARRFIGVPYVLGGTTPKSFDCSGFVRYVFAQHGIGMPRTARQQAAVGVTPYPGDLQPGDLLFFFGGQGAQHIAIYVGADTIIHASSSGGRVRLDLLSGARGRKSWFRQRLIAVRRVLPIEGYHLLPMPVRPIDEAAPTRELVELLATVPVVFE